MAESTYPTIGAGQVNVFTFPTKAHGASWTGLANIAAMFAQAQVDRCQTVGLGPFDLAMRKRYELGRTSAMEKVASTSVDKAATLEVLESGSMRFWNNLAGQEYDNTSDITQDDFDATTSEFCLLVHKLDNDKTNVIESDILWRCVVDTASPFSVPSSADDDVRISVRVTGDEHVMCANTAGKAIVELITASSSVLTVESSYAGAVERDDWPDDDDGTAVQTVITVDPSAGDTTVTVQSTTGFQAGHEVLVKSSDDSWETNKISSVGSGTLTFQDALDIDHAVGTLVKRTRGFFYFVHNADTGEYLELGTEYRVVKTDSTTLTIINVDGESDIGSSDDVWCAWSVPSGAEMWTDNDTDLYGVTHTHCKFVVSPESTFDSGTVGYTDTGNTEDTNLDFESSGSNSDTEWYAREFTAADTGKVASATIRMQKTGSPSGELWAEIWTDDGGGTSVPSARTGNPSQEIDASDLDGSGGDVTFTFTDGPTITSGTTYWLVVKTANYDYTDTTTEIIWLIDADGNTAGDEIAKADPDAGTVWTIVNTNYGADLTVNLVGAQEIKRIQGMDSSVTFTRTAQHEMGNTQPVERDFDETDVRITVPMSASDITTWARVLQKNAASVKTIRPEQNPEVYARMIIYSTEDRLAGDALICYEFPQVQRSGGEKSGTANERMTKRVTLTGDQFTIASAL